MARVVFIPFPETGHLYASFKLARALKSYGQEVHYLGIQDFEEPVRLQHFEFHPLFENAIHKGFLDQHVANGETEPFQVILSAARNGRQPGNLLSELQNVIRSTHPYLLVIDLLLSSVALMAKSMGIPSVLLNTQFYDPWTDKAKIADYELLRDVPELVLCPQEFDFPRAEKRDNCYYVESCIDQERRDVPFPWQRLSENKPLIYCSLGSQSHLIRGGKSVLRTVIDAVSASNRWQLVLTTGTHLNPEDFGEVAANITLVNRAPQLDVLKRTSIAITHGGFNTVKECIFFGIPMIVIPLIRDHPAVAARVVHHGLGVRGNIDGLSIEKVHSLIDEIDGNPLFRMRCNRMGERFRELEEAGDAVRIALSVLNGEPVEQNAPGSALLPQRFTAR
jgi:UDP:flavonoid glycosyltransferase YjiC (YdhE family)